MYCIEQSGYPDRDSQFSHLHGPLWKHFGDVYSSVVISANYFLLPSGKQMMWRLSDYHLRALLLNRPGSAGIQFPKWANRIFALIKDTLIKEIFSSVFAG